jgi:hypothetical protein
LGGGNIFTIQGNGTFRIITVTKHLGCEVKKLKVLLCYDYQNGITNEKEDMIFATKIKLLSTWTINLPNTIQFMKTIDVKVMDANVNTSNLELKSRV